jgi:tungstate transport system substrate-binding protein
MIRSILLAIALTAPVSAEEMRMAVTTSFDNSGLADILLPEIEADTGITVRLVVVGTGQALRLGAAGDVDAVLVHSRPAEEAFLAEGHGTRRTEIMYNDFVIVGPAGDPAGLGEAASAVEAVRSVADTETPFVSRGDDSGTQMAELALWDAAGIAPGGSWYRPVGAGMGAALNTAAAMGAYILADRGSWLNFGNRDGMAIAFEGDPALFNQYAYLPVDPAKNDAIAGEAAETVEAWLVSERGQGLIDDYRVAGERLFTANAE